MALTWDDKKYATGIKQIDDQHRSLFDRMNELLESCQAGAGSEEAIRTLDFLADYAEAHFGFEEDLMETHQCPNCNANKSAHAYLRNELASLRQELEREGPTPLFVIKVQERVCDWFVNHILKIDGDLRNTDTCTKSL